MQVWKNLYITVFEEKWGKKSYRPLDPGIWGQFSEKELIAWQQIGFIKGMGLSFTEMNHFSDKGNGLYPVSVDSQRKTFGGKSQWKLLPEELQSGEDGQNRGRGRQAPRLGSTDQPEPRALRCDIGGDRVTETELRQHTPSTASTIPEQKGVRDKNKLPVELPTREGWEGQNWELHGSREETSIPVPDRMILEPSLTGCSTGVTRGVQEQKYPVPSPSFFPKHLSLDSTQGSRETFCINLCCRLTLFYWLSLG